MPTTTKTNVYQKIKLGMRRNERELLTTIKRHNRDGEKWSPISMPLCWYSAKDRLIEKGLIRFSRSRVSWKSGYIATNL